MVYEYAGQLLTNSLSQHASTYTGVNAAAQGAQHLAGADFRLQLLHSLLYEGIHLPGAGAAAHVVDEIAQHLGAVFGMQHLRMELHCIKLALRILGSCYRAVGSVSGDFKAGSNLFNIVIVAHPADVLRRNIGEHGAGGINIYQGFTVFTLGSNTYIAAQQMAHELAAIANAQHRHAPGKDFRVNGGRIGQISTVGATGEDDALQVCFSLNLC